MAYRAYLCAAALCFITSHALIINAQQPVPAPTPVSQKAKPPAASASAARREVDPVAEQNRLTAISLLTTLADDARSFRDESLRARVQARVADALWETDKDRARALFRRAWEVADVDNQRRADEERRTAPDSRRPVARPNAPNLRAEVLRLTARHDRALGEEFLARLDADKDHDAQNTPDTNKPVVCPAPNDSLSPALTQRLNVARQLLSGGDQTRAMQFADPALQCVTIPALDFLTDLRTKDAATADARYLSLLARAASDPSSDSNTVTLLAAYAWSPFLYVKVNRKGGTEVHQSAERIPSPDLAQPLRAAFFRTAAQILLRPMPPPDQDKSSGGAAGTYFIIARLLPLFEQYAPDYAPALHAQQSALASDTPDNIRNGKERWLTEGLVPPDPSRDEAADLPDQLKRASNASERDEAYANAAANASHTDYARARELTDKIEDDDLRSRVRALVDYIAVNQAVSKKNTDEVIRLARTGDLTNIQRVMAFTEAAKLLTKNNPQRANEMLDEALAAARRIDGADPDRVRALIATATQLLKLDRVRVWDTLTEAAKAANTATDFTGEDGQIAIRLQTKNSTTSMSTGVPEFDLAGIFSELARENLGRAIELTKVFTNEAPRAISTLAVARAVLNEKPAKTVRR